MSQPLARKWVKHLIECNCILPQFRSPEFLQAFKGQIPFHKFIVFSELKEDGSIKPSYAQCNNCMAIHKVIEVNKSETQRREEMRALPDIDEIQNQIPEKLVGIIKRYDCQLPTWQHLEFVFRTESWGEIVVLSRERENANDPQNPGKWITKYVLILGESLWKIYTESEDDLESFYVHE